MVKYIYYDGESELQKKLDNVISNIAEGAGDRVIITCSESMHYTEIRNYLSVDPDGRNSLYKSNGKKTKVFTCPTFKGLEADDVIIIDINNKTFDESNRSFYVAATRAKKRLFVLINTDKVDVDSVINNRFPDTFPHPNKQRRLAMAMHALI